MGFYEKALRLQEKYVRGKVLSNAIQTHGLLIDDAWASFLSRNNFLIGISIDGPQHLHDTYRRCQCENGQTRLRPIFALASRAQ